MDIKLHKQATTTPKIRAEIQATPASISDSELARQFGVSDSAIRRGVTGTMSMILGDIKTGARPWPGCRP